MAQSERQFVSAVAGDLMGAIETEQRLLDRSAGRIAIGRAGVGVAVAQRLAPRPCCRVRETVASAVS